MRSLVWVDRNGRAEPIISDQAIYSWLSLAPDESRVLVGQQPDIWIYDLKRPGSKSRLTIEGATASNNTEPIWSHDGKSIFFSSNRGGDWDIYSQPTDRSLPAQVFLKRPNDQFASSTDSDGTLFFYELHPTTGGDIWALSPDGEVKSVRATRFNEYYPVVSPDGDHPL